MIFRTADAAGSKLYWTDIPTGQSIAAEVFVATLACSQLTYVEAIPSQRKTHFLAALSNALVYFGGVPQAIIPDNLKSAVTKPDRYIAEPTLADAILDRILSHTHRIDLKGGSLRNTAKNNPKSIL